MAYDGRLVRGPADEVDAYFQGNSMLALANFQSTMFNIFGGTSFYWNFIQLYIQQSTYLSTGFLTVTFYNGPNAGTLVGATSLGAIQFQLPTSAPTVVPSSQPIVIANLNNLGYRNRTGAAGYFHIGLNATIVGGAISGIIGGGQTALLS